MSRVARVVVPNVAHHVVHRAYDREPIFITDDDFEHYVANLDDCRRSLGCKVYSFCVMLNHVHLLLDPGNEPANLARLMKRIAQRQARYLKRSEKRNGRVWDGRFRSSPVAKDFLLACARYIELSPVRALIAKRPENYPWSSARPRLGLPGASVDFDVAYIGLGRTPRERARNYGSYLRDPIPVEEWGMIRRAIQSGDVTGGDCFRRDIAPSEGAEVSRRSRGRPRKAA